MSSELLLIVNPTAGGGRARRRAPAAEQALAAAGVRVRRADTRDLDHARELALDAARAGVRVAALSGDGMVGAIADVLRAVPGAELAVLPGGRGNDLARVLGIGDDVEAACRIAAGGRARPMDLGEAGAEQPGSGRAFVGIASVGFDSDANRIANEAPAWLGGLVYAYGALRALAGWRPTRFEVELDPPGERHAFTGYTVVAASSRAYGGGMHVAPAAMLDDGMLEVVLIGDVGRGRFLTNLPRVFKGTHVELPSVRVLRAREVAIAADRPFTVYADGDPIGELPLRVRALPAALAVVVPDASPAFGAASQRAAAACDRDGPEGGVSASPGTAG